MDIIEPYSPEDFKRYFKARWEILRKPWDFPKGSEIDNNENISLHIMAMNDDVVSGVGRLTYFPNEEGQIRYMGVSKNYRHQNIGTELLKYLEQEALNMGLKKIFLNSRESAYMFYSKFGYSPKGKPFDGFAGIGHTKMVKNL